MSHSKLLRWMTKAALFVSLLFVVVVWNPGVTSTQGRLAQKNEPSPPAEIKTPIISMMVASSIDEKGKMVNPRFTFPPNEPQITAVVWVGKIKGSELKVTWYKTFENGGQQTLFDHKIQVKSNDRAFSVATNASGTLEIGTYKVVASLEGQTKEIEFDISSDQAPEKTSSSPEENLFEAEVQSADPGRAFPRGPNSAGLRAASGYEFASDSEAQVAWNASGRATRSDTVASQKIQQGKPPVRGSSGTASPRPSPSSASLCSSDLMNQEGNEHDYVQGYADFLEMVSDIACSSPQPGMHTDFSAGIVGAPEKEYGTRVGLGRTYFPVYPCELPGGSDLPGTKAIVRAMWYLSIYDDKKNEYVTKTKGQDESIITLGPDTLAPRIKVVSNPARGNAVQEGDQINFEVTAQEKLPEEDLITPWQTGVKQIQIEAIPGSIKQWRNPSDVAAPCNQKTWKHSEQATFTVPKNPPSTIKFCARAQDYAGNWSQDLCGEFPVIPKSVVPANCKNKGLAQPGPFKDGVPVMGAFDPKSPKHDVISCEFSFSICRKPYVRTHEVKNGPNVCRNFYDSEAAKLTKEQFCCDCYPECASKPSPPTKRR